MPCLLETSRAPKELAPFGAEIPQKGVLRVDDSRISRRKLPRQSKRTPSPLSRARANALDRYIRWRCHVHGAKDLQVRLGPELRQSARILLGFTSKQLDAAIEFLVTQRRAMLVPSSGGVYFYLTKGGPR
jgi:hypothetical protein